MLPANSGNAGWATEKVTTILLYPRNQVFHPLESYSYLTSSNTLMKAAYYPADGVIRVFDPDSTIVDTIVAVTVTSLDLTFDQLDRRFLTWQDSLETGLIYIYWYDPTLPGYTTTQIAQGDNPCCMIDERRDSLLPNSDILLFYQRGDELLYRRQRDRYLVEYTIPQDNVDFRLLTCGMGTNFRIGLLLEAADAILVTVAGTPVLVDSANNVGFEKGTIPWPASSSNTRT